MGNTTCCQANQSNLSFEHEIATIEKKQPKLETAIQQFLDGLPQLKSSLTEGYPFEKQEQIKNKAILQKKFKLEDGLFFGKLTDKRTREGFGIMLYDDQSYYQGFWQNHLRNGKGILIEKAGQFYSGQWSKGLPHGFGFYSNPQQKYTYKGNWHEGAKHGYGEQVSSNGTSYLGNFQSGQKNGYGKFIYAGGSQYQGYIKANKPQGLGYFKNKGIRLEGNWKAGKIHGEGCCVWYNRNNEIQGRYLGQYRDGLKEGYGEYTDASGVVFKGMWINGERNDYAPFDIVNTRSSTTFF